jgi:oligosaccharide translocation protein RFT1
MQRSEFDTSRTEQKFSAQKSLLYNTQLLFVAGLVQKVINVSANQYQINQTAPEVLGRVSIQLELLLMTLLFLSREGIRIAVLKEKLYSQMDVQAAVNISWVPSCLLAMITVGISVFHYVYLSESDLTIIYMYAMSTCIECLGEPCYNLFQNMSDIKPRLSAKTLAILMKSIVSVAGIVCFPGTVLTFGMAQLSYSSTHTAVLLLYWYHTDLSILGKDDDHSFKAVGNMRILLPRSLNVPRKVSVSSTPQYIYPHILNNALSSSASSVLKHFLTESDKIVLTISASNYDQGIYAVTSNYGSIVTRLLFLPLEESSRLAFSKLVAELKHEIVTASSRIDQHELEPSMRDEQSSHRIDGQAIKSRSRSALSSSKTSDNDKVIALDHSVDDSSSSTERSCLLLLQALRSDLLQLLQLVALVGMCFVIFGVPYSEVFVRHVLSKQWQTLETIQSLSVYCIYLLALGINGITEAFVESCSSSSASYHVNRGLILSSGSFIIAVVPAVSYFGTKGIILANIVGMVVRIASNVYYIIMMFANTRLFFSWDELSKISSNAKDHNRNEHTLFPSMHGQSLLSEFNPSITWISSAVLSALVAYTSRYNYNHNTARSMVDTLLHLLVGGVTGLLFLGISLYSIFPDRLRDWIRRLTQKFSS